LDDTMFTRISVLDRHKLILLILNARIVQKQ